MSPDTSNGRVTIAKLGTKLDRVIEDLEENKRDHKEIRDTLSDISTAVAVNDERWDNHHDLHKRERGILGALSLISSTVSGTLSTWWASR